MIYRVSEAIASVLRLLRASAGMKTLRLVSCSGGASSRGGCLDSWANPIIYVPGGGPTQQDEIVTFIESAARRTAANAIASLVEVATRDLFVMFDGTKISNETYEEQTRRILERRLGS